jgi:hypothetical protein
LGFALLHRRHPVEVTADRGLQIGTLSDLGAQPVLLCDLACKKGRILQRLLFADVAL